MVIVKRFVFFLLIKWIGCCLSALQTVDKNLCHKFCFISEKICSESYAANFQMSEVSGPALGTRMQCNNPTSKVLDLSCKSSLGFGSARVTMDPNQGHAQQNPLYWAVGLVCSWLFDHLFDVEMEPLTIS